MEDLTLYIIVIILSIIQSIFGVGILLFGTPTLIYLDYSFINTLNILLPCSLLISFFQLNFNTKSIKKYTHFKKNFFFYCITSIFLSLLILSKYSNDLNFEKLIGITLILILFLKIFRHLKKNFNFFLNKYHRSINFIIGLIHGITNMGGSFLTIYITEIEKNDLSQRRYLIGYTYFFMASTQLFSLILSGNLLISKQILIYILIATLGYFIAQIISKKIDIKKHDLAFNIILLFYAMLLLTK